MHAHSLRHLEPHFAKKLLFEIRPEYIHAYQRARLKEGASGRSINIEIALIRLVLRKAKLWANIQDDVKPLSENRDTGRELSDDEMVRLLSACKVSISRGLYPAVLTSFHTGLRSEELRLLRWHQVDLLEGTIIVGKSKTEGGEGRLVYLSALAVQTLQNWRSQFPDVKPNHAVFPRESYGLKGKKGTFGGAVVPYRTFPTSQLAVLRHHGGQQKKRLASPAAGTISGIPPLRKSQRAARLTKLSRHCLDGCRQK